jgi:hypothetical protein
VTFVLVRALRPLTGLRLDPEREFNGLDFTTHANALTVTQVNPLLTVQEHGRLINQLSTSR